MQLARDDVRAVLARASEIHAATEGSFGDRESIIQAAEEAGIGRAAVERALRECMPDAPMTAPLVGDTTFAKSADGKFYVATVVSVSDDRYHVRFLRGGEHVVTLEELRPGTFLPGERVVVQWPWWGPWTCTIVSYAADTQQVTVTDGWSETRTFPIAEVWLAPRKSVQSRRTRMTAALIGAGAAAGAAIGSIVTALLLR